MGDLAPGLVLVFGALLVPFLRGRLLQAWILALPLLSMAHLLSMPLGHTVEVTFFDYALTPVRIDRLSRIFGVIFHIAAFVSALFALHVKDRLQHVAGLAYAGAAIAAVFAGDLVTLFVYWELTAVTSVFLILARRTERARRASVRYLLIQVGSGVLLLAGTVLHVQQTGSVAFDHLGLVSTGTWLVFAAFGIKAAFPLLHNWLQDAYPEATVTGTVFLSAFTTKLAIYALARGFAGEGILVPIGATMAAFPIFFAVIENDLRRVLAYSLNNQLGYMVVGIGIGTELAINGAAAHAFAHILYKGLLFMAMGAVLYRTGTAKGSELGGLYKSMPFTTVFCIVGAASISAFPLFSGFVSKSLILSAAAEGHLTITYLVLLFASAGVFHHSGIKIPFFAFFAHDSGKRVEEAPWNMLAAMGIASFLCIAVGVYPAPLYALLPYEVDYAPYTPSHVVTQLQLLLFSALAFVFLQKMRLYPPELRSTVLDTDWMYRRLVPGVVQPAYAMWTQASERAVMGFEAGVTQLSSWAWRTWGPNGVIGGTWSTGRTAFWAAVLLCGYLVLDFLE